MRKTIGAIAKREMKRLASKPLYAFCMLFAPLFSAVFFLTLMDSGLPVKMPVAVVDLDNSASSRILIRQLSAFEQTDVVMRTTSFHEARVAMQQGRIYGIYHIPARFAVDAASGKQPQLSFYTNNAYLIAGSLIYRDMKTLSVLAGGSVGLQTGLAQGYTEDQIMAQLQPVVIDTHTLGNPWLNYSVYLCNTLSPGILQLMILLVTVFSIGSEIKADTSREWLKMGNNSLIVSLTGKLLPHTLIFTLVGMTICSLLYGYAGFPLQNGWWPMWMAMLLLVLASQAMGILMIGVLPTLRLGLSFASLYGILTFSVVGFSFPVSAMYPPVQALSNLFPLRHYFLIYVDQALNGRSLYYSWPQYLFLLLFLLIPFLILGNLKKALLYFKYIP
jgi:ABC-2 type transport system permease protein